MKRKRKKLLSIVLIISMVIGMWPVTERNVVASEAAREIELTNQSSENAQEQFAEFAGGDGSEENPYQISSSEMFREMAEYPGKNFVLISDLNLSASPRINFEGRFDGNGYTIEIDFSEENGMFNQLGEASVITDCNIDIGNNNLSTLPLGMRKFGAVALSNSGLIKRCVVKGSVLTSTYTDSLQVIGSICAANGGNIEKCRNDADYSILVSPFSHEVALLGICSGSGTVTQCLNTGNLSAGVMRQIPNSGVFHNYVAGINRFASHISECANIGNITLNFYSELTGSGAAHNYAGFITNDEFDAYGPTVPKSMSGIESCYIGENVKFSFSTYNLGSGGGVNSKSTVLYADDVTGTQVKAEEEILEWWDSVLADDEDDGGETWVPDGAFSISKSGAWVSGKECALYGSYSASTPGNAETEAEEIVWSSSDPSILDVSDTIIDFNVADVDNNHVSIQKSFTAKKAGTVTITATAPDGRSESITVDVEPELVAVGTDDTITKETEITVFKATLEESNAEYLEKVISQVEVTIADDDSGNAQIKNYYYKIAEDGLSAEIIILLEPLQEDIIEINGVSAGGQEITARINTVVKELSFAPYPNTCMQEARFTITAYYYTPTEPENIKWVCSDEDAVEFSDTTVQILDTTDEYNWYKISADVTTKKVGDYSLTLALDDKSLTEPLTIKAGTGFSAYKDGWCIINMAFSFGYDENDKIPLSYYFDTYGVTFASTVNGILNLFQDWGGNCFGLSLLAVAEYNGQIDLSNYFNNNGNTLNEYGFETVENWDFISSSGQNYSGNIYTLQGNDDIIEGIERAQISLYSSEIADVEVFKWDSDYSELLDYLNQDDAAPLIIGIVNLPHAIVTDTSLKPFEVENGVYRVYCYNPNGPQLTNKLNNSSPIYLRDQTYIDFDTNTGRYYYYDGDLRYNWEYNLSFSRSIQFYEISRLGDKFFDGPYTFDDEHATNLFNASELTINQKSDDGTTEKIFSVSNGECILYKDCGEYYPFYEDEKSSNDLSAKKGYVLLPYGTYELDSKNEASIMSIQDDYIYAYNIDGEAKAIIDDSNIILENEGLTDANFAIAIQNMDGTVVATAEGTLDSSTDIYLKILTDGDEYYVEAETDSSVDKIETSFILDGTVVSENFHMTEDNYYSDNGDGTHTKVSTNGDNTTIEPHTYQNGECIYCGAEEPEEHVHEYGTPEFNWSEDYTTCTAVFTCKDGDDQQSIECEVTDEVTDATCTENGKAIYTAKGTFGDKEYTDVKEQEIPASGHIYGTPEFNWSEDYQTCTAVITCESCDDEQKMECDIVSETTDPT